MNAIEPVISSNGIKKDGWKNSHTNPHRTEKYPTREQLIKHARSLYLAKKLNKKSQGSFKVQKPSGQIFPPPNSSYIRKSINTKLSDGVKYFFKSVIDLKKDLNFLFNRKKIAASEIWQGLKIVLAQKTQKIKLLKKKEQDFFTLPSKEPVFNFKFSQSIRSIFKPFSYAFMHYPLQTMLTLSVATLIFSGVYLLHQVVFLNLPSPSELKTRPQPVTTRILDRHGEVLFRIYKDENRTIVPLSEISPNMIKATIAIEDQNFYFHHGISLKGIVRAFISNSRHETVQGGSTITQQLVKNRLLSPEKTLTRKIREALLAVLVEFQFSKKEILEMYFNQVAYGGSTYGVEEAAFRYFGKTAQDLDLAEASLLAGLPAAPSVYSPFGPNPEISKKRQEEVLRRMVEDHYITENQAKLALAEELKFRRDVIDIKAPHFVMYVKQLLAAKYGEDVVNQGGLEVVTTLDLPLQEEAQDIVSKEIANLKNLRISNGAALVTNPQTGEILAMVGGANYFDFEHDGQVNVVLRPRQPGSSIKPITYSLALERGYTPSTLIQDAPITYQVPGSPPYSPKNYDGRFHGNVTLRESLASSYNVPAVKTLATLGVSNLIDHAENLGITTWKDRKRFGLSLTLGGGEVLMTDMATAYGTFATGGYRVPLNPILKITNAQGEILYENDCALTTKICQGKRVLSAQTAYLISNILSDNRARTPAFGPMSSLNIPGQEVAVKTGTTNNLRDNWAIGYTTNRLVSVWVGNNDNTPMSYVASGVTGASPIWNKIMRLLLDENQPHFFSQPSGIVKTKICATTNTLVCPSCPKVVDEVYRAGTQPQKPCSSSFFQPKTTTSP